MTFLHDRSGAIAILAALSLPVVLGFVALSVEYGHGLLKRVENQRAADLASYAGALVYSKTKSEEKMADAARDAAALNGVAAEDVQVALGGSPKGQNSQAVHVTITTRKTLYLAPILGASPELSVAADAFSSIGASDSGCILALDGAGSGITLSGGVRIDGECHRVSSNAGITAPCGTRITAESVSYDNGELAPCKWSENLVTPDGNPAPREKVYTDDPLKNNAGVATFDERFKTIREASWPQLGFSGQGPDIEFLGVQVAKTEADLAAIGCSYDPAFYNKDYMKIWIVTCEENKEKTINIGSIEVGSGDITVQFNTSGDPDTVYNFSGGIKNPQGGSITFGSGTFNIAKGVNGASMTFGSGTFRIGRMNDQYCNGYSICSSGTVTFGGPSTFILEGGIHTGGGVRLSLGSGNANSYVINSLGEGDGIVVGSGSKIYLADATVDGSVFRVNGHINASGGGGCLVLPASEHHDISGHFHVAGAVKLGAGIYTIDGYFMAAVGGANCDGYGGVYGEDVTLLISGIDTPSGWACSGKVFCLDGGNGITLKAPDSGPYANLAVIGPQAEDNTAGVTITSGGRGDISGAFYFPNAEIDMGGGGQIASGSDGCLQLVGASITMSGGAKAMSECSGINGNGRVALVQ